MRGSPGGEGGLIARTTVGEPIRDPAFACLVLVVEVSARGGLSSPLQGVRPWATSYGFNVNRQLIRFDRFAYQSLD
jgi:hypothetical protein